MNCMAFFPPKTKLHTHLISNLNNLHKNRKRQTEEQVAHHRPAAAVLLVNTDRRDESLPGVFIEIDYQCHTGNKKGEPRTLAGKMQNFHTPVDRNKQSK